MKFSFWDTVDEQSAELSTLPGAECAREGVQFLTLPIALAPLNRLELDLWDGEVPLVYPSYTEVPSQRQHLTENHICSQYWPKVTQRIKEDDLERDYADSSLPLPIDQRHSASDKERIKEVVRRD